MMESRAKADPLAWFLFYCVAVPRVALDNETHKHQQLPAHVGYSVLPRVKKQQRK